MNICCYHLKAVDQNNKIIKHLLIAIKKTELYSSLWQSCDELRGGMDASQYKDYVLTFLFLKYVSDKYLNDPKAMVVVPEGCTFPDIIKLKGDKEVGEKLNIVLEGIAKENELPWLANKDNDFNDEDRLGKGKEMVDRLSKLIGIFEGLNFGGNSAQGDDLLGDAYEYLMRNFATKSGKSKGQFYTPAEVSRILAKVVGITKDTTQDQTVYDPTCGSGSLLLKAADEARNGLSIYGQEKDVATTALCRMNMILHNNANAEIAPGGHSTLAEPEFKNDNSVLKTFAATQQLLTGKKRLPPFDLTHTGYKQTELGEIPEDWEVRKFTDVTSLITCGIAATPTYVSESVGYPFLSSTNVKNGKVVWKNFKYISPELHNQLYRNNPPIVGDILYSRVGTIGEAAVIEDDFEFSVYVSLTLIKPQKNVLNSYFLSYLLNSQPYKNRAKEQVYLGGGVGNLNVDVVRNYPIVQPSVEEQSAIARVLSDMDKEIEALQQRLNKTQQLKQGMMQELLTGRTRLL
jgi:hypothetical protein